MQGIIVWVPYFEAVLCLSGRYSRLVFVTFVVVSVAFAPGARAAELQPRTNDAGVQAVLDVRSTVRYVFPTSTSCRISSAFDSA
jgi:hypothetical protein